MATFTKSNLDTVLANLHKEIEKIEGRSLKGLIRAGIVIRRDMENTPPKIPIDTGNLRASWFIATSKGGTPEGKSPKFKGKKAGDLSSGHSETIAESKSLAKNPGMPVIVLGFSANYAMPVHEMMGVSDIKKGKKQISPLTKMQRQSFGMARFRRPGSGPKFLEASLKRNTKEMLQVIGEEARIPK